MVAIVAVLTAEAGADGTAEAAGAEEAAVVATAEIVAETATGAGTAAAGGVPSRSSSESPSTQVLCSSRGESKIAEVGRVSDITPKRIHRLNDQMTAPNADLRCITLEAARL